MSKNKKPKTLSTVNLEMVDVQPLTENQEVAVDSESHLMLYGVAGTGKTFLACSIAFNAVQKRLHSKVVIVRSAVPSKDQGFLPGNDKQKAEVYEVPYQRITNELFQRGDAYQILKQHNIVEFITTSYIRGTTITDAVIIVDEFQNLTFEELDTVITRVGKNCRIIFCGDVTQTDLKKDYEKAGADKFMTILDAMGNFERVNFGIEDIVRSGLVKDYIIQKHRLGF